MEPCADSVCRGAGLAAVGAGIALEVMAGCRDDLSLFYSLAANCAHLVAGVTVFGAGRGLCADEFGDVLMVVVVDGCIQESFVAQITNFYCVPLFCTSGVVYIGKAHAVVKGRTVNARHRDTIYFRRNICFCDFRIAGCYRSCSFIKIDIAACDLIGDDSVLCHCCSRHQ